MNIIQILPARSAVAWFEKDGRQHACDVVLWALVQDTHRYVVGMALIDGLMVICDEQDGFLRYEQRGGYS